MTRTDLSDIYRDYIASLNKQDWPKLERFVHDEVYYNGQRIGILGYRKMLEMDFHEIPDLHFDVQLLISNPPYSEPARRRLYAKGEISWSLCKREENCLCRKCIL